VGRSQLSIFTFSVWRDKESRPAYSVGDTCSIHCAT